MSVAHTLRQSIDPSTRSTGSHLFDNISQPYLCRAERRRRWRLVNTVPSNLSKRKMTANHGPAGVNVTTTYLPTTKGTSATTMLRGHLSPPNLLHWRISRPLHPYLLHASPKKNRYTYPMELYTSTGTIFFHKTKQKRSTFFFQTCTKFMSCYYFTVVSFASFCVLSAQRPRRFLVKRGHLIMFRFLIY
jgi:hypothetical protein